MNYAWARNMGKQSVVPQGISNSITKTSFRDTSIGQNKDPKGLNGEFNCFNPMGYGTRMGPIKGMRCLPFYAGLHGFDLTTLARWLRFFGQPMSRILLLMVTCENVINFRLNIT